MRLITRKFHRAFPELDRYDDQRCERFVRAAAGSGGRGLLRWVGALAITIAYVGLMVGLIAMLLTMDRNARFSSGRSWLVQLVMVALGLGVVLIPVVAYVARDVLLRLALRKVLRKRAVCAGCGYRLLGLPVSERTTVLCPECEHETDVDASLGELVRDDKGNATFAPSDNAMPKAWIWTPRVRRGVRAGIKYGLVPLLMLMLMSAVGWEWFIRTQAVAAQRAKPGVAGLVAHAATLTQPDLAANSTNAWARLESARTAMEGVVLGFPAQAVTSRGERADIDYSLVASASEREPSGDAERLEYETISRDYSSQLIERYREAGVFGLFREMAQARDLRRPMDLPAESPLFTMLLPALGEVRDSARLHAARMRLARRADDPAEFLDAGIAGMALARMTEHQPLLIDRMVSVAVESLILTHLREVLLEESAGNPGMADSRWLDAVGGVLESRGAQIPLSFAVEGERLVVIDAVAWVFSDPARARFGRFSPALHSTMLAEAGYSSTLHPLGTLRGNLARVDSYFARCSKAMSTPIALINPADFEFASGEVTLVTAMFAPAMSNAFTVDLTIRTERDGARLMLALERYRAAQGAYPSSLGALVPRWIASIPLDPFDQQPIRYRVIDPITDARKRGYLLYVVGRDRRDDGGIESPIASDRVLSIRMAPVPQGTPTADLIVNSSNR